MSASRIAPGDLDGLRAYAVEVGGDLRLVQGAGGNVSLKQDDVMWIKASGTRLSQALTEPIFVPMRLTDTRAAVLSTEDLTTFVAADHGGPELRPSIETSLHALLPHAVVVHVHSTGAIAAGLSGGAALSELPGWFDLAVVPYAKPGVELARAVFAEVGRGVSDRPLAMLLLNHGLVAAARDAATAGRIVATVQSKFASRPGPERGGRSGVPGWSGLHPAATVTSEEAALLRLGPFTPDQAVFMGSTPFTSLHDSDPTSIAAVDDDGSIWVREDAGADEREIVQSIVDVARLMRRGPARALTAEQVDELINWEAEKWRRDQRR